MSHVVDFSSYRFFKLVELLQLECPADRFPVYGDFATYPVVVSALYSLFLPATMMPLPGRSDPKS